MSLVRGGDGDPVGLIPEHGKQPGTALPANDDMLPSS